MKKIVSTFMLCCLWCLQAAAQPSNNNASYNTLHDISYTTKSDRYAQERLKLDVHYPENAGHDCPVVIWFHGGGLTQGNKEIPAKLKNKGMVIVGVNYRLLPKVTVDSTLDDCAEAVAWVVHNIGQYNGSNKKLFIAGHSAGGYITLMLALDKQWLTRYGIDADSVAGYIPFSGQAISHFAYRKMQGIPNLQPVIDRYAPLYWVRKECPPLVLITGDRNMELYGRYEENAYLWRMMKLTGNTSTELYEIGGHGHVAMMDAAFHILENTVCKILGLPFKP